MSLVVWGLGPGGGGEASFVMRAWHITAPIGYVYWTVTGAPDGGGASAPYPPGELQDIVVVHEFIPAA
jgi:hypothetical protein